MDYKLSYLKFEIQIPRFSPYWPIRSFRFNLIGAISAWKLTAAIAVAYCSFAQFLRDHYLNTTDFNGNPETADCI